MNFALLDLDSGNEIGHYDSELAALAAVRKIAAVSDEDPVLALEAIDQRGKISVVAEGGPLLERAVSPSNVTATRKPVGLVGRHGVARARMSYLDFPGHGNRVANKTSAGRSLSQSKGAAKVTKGHKPKR
jgi:hypothetical protein